MVKAACLESQKSRARPPLWYSADSERFSIKGNFRDREVACSASDCQGSNFESCVWRAVSSHSLILELYYVHTSVYCSAIPSAYLQRKIGLLAFAFAHTY